MRLWPVRCLSCGDELSEGDGKLVCRRELAEIPWVGEEERRCRHCDQRLWLPEVELCYDCASRQKEKEVYLEQSQALFFYRGVARRLYQVFKFEGRRYALEDLHAVAESLRQKWWSRVPEADVVVSVPSLWFKTWQRGFSPVELFWRRFFPSLRTDVLARKWVLQEQKALHREERQALIRGQFMVKKPEVITGKRVLIVDDVYTTGSTVEEVARVLRQAHALSVVALVIFREEFGGM